MMANEVKFGSAGTPEVSEEYILRSAQSFQSRHVLLKRTSVRTERQCGPSNCWTSGDFGRKVVNCGRVAHLAQRHDDIG